MKTTLQWCLLFLVFGLSFLKGMGQATLKSERGFEAEFSMSFLRYEPTEGALYNVLKVRNWSNQTLHLQPEVVLPEGWDLIFGMPEAIAVEPGGANFFLPLELTVSNKTEGGKQHKVLVKLKDDTSRKVFEVFFEVLLPKVSAFDFFPMQEKIHVPINENDVDFEMQFKNEGNLFETLSVKFLTPPNIKISPKGLSALKLSPGRTTNITFKANYFDIVQTKQEQEVRILVRNTYSKKTRQAKVIFIKQKNKLDVRTNQRKNNSLEVFGVFAQNDPAATTGLGMRGVGFINFDQRRFFQYDIANQNVLNHRGVEDWQTLYMRYQGKHFFSELNQQFLTLGYLERTNEEKEWEATVTRNIVRPVNRASFQRKDAIKNSQFDYGISLQNDSRIKSSTGIVFFNSHIPLKKDHRLKIDYRNVFAKEKGFQPYSTNGYRFSLAYEGEWNNRWRFLTENNYHSSTYIFGQRATFQNRSQLRWQLPKGRDYLSLETRFRNRAPYAWYRGKYLPQGSVNSQMYSLRYQANGLGNSRIEAKLEYQNYNSTRLSQVSDNFLDFDYKTLNGVILANVHKNVWLGAWHRYIQVADFLTPLAENLMKDIKPLRSTDLSARYQNHTLSFSYNFRFGDNIYYYLSDRSRPVSPNIHRHSVRFMWQAPWLKLGLNYFKSEEQERLSVPINIQAFFFQQKLAVRAMCHINHQFERRLTFFYVRPSAEWKLGGNWEALLRARIFQKRQPEILEFISSYSPNRSVVEAGVRKHFRLSTQKVPLANLKIICFKDENGDGIMDKGEEGVEGIRVGLSREETELNAMYNDKFQPSQLFSEADGKMTYKNLRTGNYHLKINQLLSRSSGYFNVLPEEFSFLLASNQALYIPFAKGKTIHGKVRIKRTEHSTYKKLPKRGIRIRATNEAGKKYSTLTDSHGNFQLFVPFSEYYLLEIKNPYGDEFELKKNIRKVNLSEETEQVENVEFLIEERIVEVEWN